MKNPTLWKSLIKSSLHDHNTAVLIAEIILTGSYFQVTASTKYLKNCSGERIWAWKSAALASSDIFFYFSYELNNDENTTWILLLSQLSSQNFLKLDGLNLKFLLRSSFGYMAQQLWWTATYYEIPKVKRDGTKRNSNFKRQTGGK